MRWNPEIAIAGSMYKLVVGVLGTCRTASPGANLSENVYGRVLLDGFFIVLIAALLLSLAFFYKSRYH